MPNNPNLAQPAQLAALVDAIRNNESPRQFATEGCTPFIGSGLSAVAYPRLKSLLGDLVANAQVREWVPRRLDIVSEWMAVTLDDAVTPKRKLARLIRDATADGSDARGWEALRTLARMPFPLYITTNYDDLLERALREQGREPITLVSNWFSDDPALFDGYPAVGDLAKVREERKAVVFHIHGALELLDSIVLTEADYVDFLIAFTRSGRGPQQRVADAGCPPIIPPFVDLAFRNHALLLIGYSMEDINFRVLLRAIRDVEPRRRTRSSLSIQLPPGETTVCQQILRNSISEFFSSRATVGEPGVRAGLLDVVGRTYDRIEQEKAGHVDSHEGYLRDFFRDELHVSVIWNDAVEFIDALANAYWGGAPPPSPAAPPSRSAPASAPPVPRGAPVSAGVLGPRASLSAPVAPPAPGMAELAATRSAEDRS